MTRLVPAADIERIVGIQRHETWHYARAVSVEATVYLLHSARCLEAAPLDLTLCPFSLALDRGLDNRDWEGLTDRPVHVTIDAHSGLLVPVRLRTR